MSTNEANGSDFKKGEVSWSEDAWPQELYMKMFLFQRPLDKIR